MAAKAGLTALFGLFPGGVGGGAGPPPRPLDADVNRSPARQLMLLPGIGPARAAAIVEERSRTGPFDTPGDLVRVHGIGPRTVERILPFTRAESRPRGPPAPTEGDP